jgi:hypothetical protein
MDLTVSNNESTILFKTVNLNEHSISMFSIWPEMSTVCRIKPPFMAIK